MTNELKRLTKKGNLEKEVNNSTHHLSIDKVQNTGNVFSNKLRMYEKVSNIVSGFVNYSGIEPDVVNLSR